jgi:hypothetical protein
MRIPKYYKQRGWQRFIAGVILGIIGGWVFFFVLYGAAQDMQIEKINELQEEIINLKRQKKVLVEDEQEKNEELEKKLTVQDIEININGETDLTESEKLKLINDMKEQLSPIISSDVETVEKNIKLLYLIENKEYTIEKEKYRVSIRELFMISSTLKITVDVKETTS